MTLPEMKYIAVVHYHLLDHSMFMKSFAEAMSRQRGCSGIILHGDSAYTERVIQTGIMRKEAVIRSTKDLNHRIVALLADYGISGIGINGYQKKIIQKNKSGMTIDAKWLDGRPPGTHLVLSNLVWDTVKEDVTSIPLAALAGSLSEELNRKIIFFNPNDHVSQIFTDSTQSAGGTLSKMEKDAMSMVPEELKPLPSGSYFSSVSAFGKLPDTSGLQRFYT